MDRPIVYVDENVLDTDFLNSQKNTMIALGMALQAIIGTGTLVDGLACSPTGPASLQVLVAPGSIYAPENVDGTAYGSLSADTTHQIVKQGIVLDTTTLNCPAPSTTGFSINYLIQVAYQDQDTGSTVLPYYDALNPSVAYNGPNNTGVSQNTVRKGACVIAVKAGTAATTGTQVTPSADAGYTGIWVVTVANGATTITSGNIAAVSGAPFIANKLTALAPLASPALTGVPTVPTAAPGTNTTQAASTAFVTAAVGGTGSIAQPEGGITHGRNIAWASNTTVSVAASSIIMKDSSGHTVKVSAPSATLNSATSGANGLDTGSVASNQVYYIYGIYNSTSSTFASLMSLSSSAPTLPSGYTYSALLSVVYTDGSSHFIGFTHKGVTWAFLVGSNLANLPILWNGSTGTYGTSYATISLSSLVPTALVSTVKLSASATSSSTNQSAIAPNNSYGNAGSPTNPPPIQYFGANTASTYVGELLLETSSIYVQAQTGSFGFLNGFTLNI